MEVVSTKTAGDARALAASIDLNQCTDGIICIGGDGLVNEVLNGFLSRASTVAGIPAQIGIVPAGSDNSLACSVLGIRDPISAAILITKGGSTPVNIFAVKWSNSGAMHFGLTAFYCGYLSDVLELSENYRKQFGPMRYLVAGLNKFLMLSEYRYEIEFLPLDLGDSQHDETNEDVPSASSLANILDAAGCSPVAAQGTEKWASRKGPFLIILVCNHSCKSGQALGSPAVAPQARPDDMSLDLLLVHGRGRLRLLAFFLALQIQTHASLPYVECIKVRSVRVRPAGGGGHGWCGIDGELLRAGEELECSVLEAQCRLMGAPPLD